MRAHIFDSTGEAYDCVQCDDDIKRGDLLIIASEKIVGIADTWPVAVTKENGKLHRISDAKAWLNSFQNEEQEIMAKAFEEARHLAQELGWL